MVNTKINLCGIEIDNPIIPASGTFGFGAEFWDLYDINILGTFSFKGTTKEPRYGNDTPRIAEFHGGMINSVGLQNPGIHAVIDEELPELQKHFHKKVMANISGFSIDEFTYCCELIDKVDCVGWIELNISCPNVHGGGMSFGTSTKSAGEAVKAVRKVTTKPIIIKLTPNVTNITEIALACEAEGADGVSMINTPMGMRINLRNKKPILKNKFGGMSGDALLPIALRMVYQTYEKVKIPIVGMGGISSAENVIEMMLAGATAVGVGAANLVDPFISKTIIEELPTVMKKYGINDLSSIIGGAH